MIINEPIGPMRVPIYNWAGEIETEAVKQSWNLAQFPYAFHHIALMPDCHSGYGMPIGGVLATDTVVIPNAVGVDIGCGMLSVRALNLNMKDMTTEQLTASLKGLFSILRETIPTGFNHHKIKQDIDLLPPLPEIGLVSIVAKELQSAQYQIGTLGGGNHFIEIQKDEKDDIWFTIHSGSRNLGHKVATHYNNVAKSKKDNFYHQIPEEWDLAYLPTNSVEGMAYLEEMNYCRMFAYFNRDLMRVRVEEAMQTAFFHDIEFSHGVNIAHNYASLENHFGHQVWVHRKGATRANENQIGIIPGSQGSATYIVSGLGNPDSFKSCSHGAGRVMSRTSAKKNLNLAEEIAKVEEAGVLVHGIRQQNDLDEAPGSYKDINDVMNKQKDLVKVLHTLRPIACMKG